MVFRCGLASGRLDSSPAKPVLRCLPILLAALFVAGRPAHAITHASILVDARTGQVLEADNADALAHPASLTKLMTLYLTFQRLEEGKLSFDTELYVSRHAAWQQPSKLWLRAGSVVSVRDCILGITGHSANDAAVVLAENIAGSESAFVDLMNQEARTLGMSRTTFLNANGLPNNAQWTTARDMATLALALIHTFPQYYHFFDNPTFSFQGRIFNGFDHMLDEYPGVDGMKTGYIYTSGFNIVTSAVRDGRRLVGVVLGGSTAHARDLQMIALLNNGFAAPAANTQMVASAVVPAPAAAPAVAAQPLSAAAETLRPAAGQLRPATGRMRPVAFRLDLPRQRAWTIQIGDRFRNRYSGYRVLRDARRTAPTPLRRGHAEVIHLRREDYLARFADLTYPMAERACSALQARRFSCRILPHLPARRGEFADTLATALPTGE